MMEIQSLEFARFFGAVDEPRMQRSRQHGLLDILFVSVAATIAGADGPSDIADFAEQQLDWCRQFVPLENGVPSHDTIGRVLSLIQPEQFQAAFLEWIAAFTLDANERATAKGSEPRFVPMDGKTLHGSRGAKDRANPLHLVSAWATQQGVTLGQVAVDAKSNEITAIPRLLQMLELSGAIVSIDAMGCQKTIAAEIVKGGGDYALAVKENQPTLHAALEAFFLERQEQEDFATHGCRQYCTTTRSRGRDATRYHVVAPVPPSWRALRREWKGLKSIGQVITATEEKGTRRLEIRYYLLSRPAKVNEFARCIRSHWSIESMHWILDVVFSEDHSRLRNGHSAENYSFLRKFVVSLLKQDTSPGSLKGKRKRAAWNTDFLETLLLKTK